MVTPFEKPPPEKSKAPNGIQFQYADTTAGAQDIAVRHDGRLADTGEKELGLGFPIISIADHHLAGEKPPAPQWNQQEAIGPEAQTQAGRSIEKTALAQLGQSIDDGYGADGCMEAVSNHILKPHFKEIGRRSEFPGFINTSEFVKWAKRHPELVDVEQIPQRDLRTGDVQPGDIVIGIKSDGNHAMVAARLPASWGGSESTIAFLGNTGHPETAPDGPNKPHFRVQEFLGPPEDEARFGQHHGGPESASPQNPYNIRGAHWIIVRFKV